MLKIELSNSVGLTCPKKIIAQISLSILCFHWLHLHSSFTDDAAVLVGIKDYSLMQSWHHAHFYQLFPLNTSCLNGVVFQGQLVRLGDSDGQLGEGRVTVASLQRQGLGFLPCGCRRFTPHLWPSHQNPVSTVCNCLTLPIEKHCPLSIHWERKPSWALGTLKPKGRRKPSLKAIQGSHLGVNLISCLLGA